MSSVDRVVPSLLPETSDLNRIRIERGVSKTYSVIETWIGESNDKASETRAYHFDEDVSTYENIDQMVGYIINYAQSEYFGKLTRINFVFSTDTHISDNILRVTITKFTNKVTKRFIGQSTTEELSSIYGFTVYTSQIEDDTVRTIRNLLQYNIDHYFKDIKLKVEDI